MAQNKKKQVKPNTISTEKQALTILIDCFKTPQNGIIQQTLLDATSKENFQNKIILIDAGETLQASLTEKSGGELPSNVKFTDREHLKEKLPPGHVAFINGGALAEKINLLPFNTLPEDVLSQWSAPEYQEKETVLDYTYFPHVQLMPTEKLHYVLDLAPPTNQSLFYYTYKSLKAARIPLHYFRFKNLSLVRPNKTKNNTAVRRLQFWFWWFFKSSLTEKNNAVNQYKFITESGYFRMAFASLAVILFVLLSVLSFDAGISGDEITLLKQAEKSYDFFATFGEDRAALDKSGRDPMYAYGQSFDLITYAIAEWLNIENIFELRHLVNTWIGYLAMLFVGLLATRFMGWRAGLIALIAMVLSPRFLGHSWNNPKDIPFAFGVIFTTYFIFKFCQYLPRISLRNLAFIAVGLAITISIRIGGLILVGYLLLFSGLTYISKVPLKTIFSDKKERNYLLNVILALFYAVLAGYILGIALWPYALVNPIKNPLNALELMTNFSISLRQLFQGEVVWSDNLPWFYGLKYMWITIPIFIFAGLAALLFTLKKASQKAGSLNLFLLLFAFVFPILYTIYKDSNLYGGWRHLMFAYPPLVVLAGLGINNAIAISKNKIVKYTLVLLFAALAVRPMIHIVKNHPHQYVYYNEIQGGIAGAYGEYEMDYYFHSFKEGVNWLIENELKAQFDSTEKIIVGSNAPINYLFKDYRDYIKPAYRRYYERGDTEWDYMLVVNSYISAEQLEKGTWPPSNTIYTVDVDGYPICAVLERKTNLDYQAFQAFKKQDYAQAVNLYEQALKTTPDIESALINLGSSYQALGMYSPAKQTFEKCLDVYPKYDKALLMLGLLELNANRLNESANYFRKVIESNKKYGPAYYYLGLIYYNTGDPQTASQYLNHAITHSPRYKPAYQLMAECLKQLGQEQQAQQYLKAAQSLN